jgi:hypothetical protein
MYADQQKDVLEALFVEQQLAEDGALALQELRARFTTDSAAEDDETPPPEFDALAYTNELRRQLIDVQSLPETALADLARERAENTRTAILEHDENLQSRINIAEIKSISKKPGDPVRMKVSLSTGRSE